MGKKKPTKKTTKPALPLGSTAIVPLAPALLDDLQKLIRSTREHVAQAVNSALVLLYWQVGHRIRADILDEQRAGYGEEIVSTLSKELTNEFGDGFSRPNLFRMIRFAEVFPDQQIVSTLSRQLGWSHFVEIVPLKEPLQRDFYAEMCRVERWSVRTLRDKIGGMLFERTALSRKPKELARQELVALKEEDQLSADLVFRDPYLLDFLGLKETYSEADLEAAILREIEHVLLELGDGFCFVARQKRITVGADDFYLDLLFYHRNLRRLIAVELKLDKLKPADKGQMELYLRWLEKHDVRPGEEPPLGLILCSNKDDEQVELLQLDRSGIRVASYLTELPPRPLLEKRLHEAVRLAQARLGQRAPTDEGEAK
jgi:predicted nuclease of restriction endonuclease-like (RecB) superfamily